MNEYEMQGDMGYPSEGRIELPFPIDRTTPRQETKVLEEVLGEEPDFALEADPHARSQ